MFVSGKATFLVCEGKMEEDKKKNKDLKNFFDIVVLTFPGEMWMSIHLR